MQDAGSMILEQQPMKVAESIILFLKGIGYFASLNMLEISKKRDRHVKQQLEMNQMGKIKSPAGGYSIY